ncbi:MAG: electron transfer flavoprotein subunit beta/FixA family protein [Candidatus Bathyarchaeota archaeon]|nr:electron transfer flavoprotein subunit beta/FixA family protein [Candidatus Bathyarchaeota archaeon]
MEKGLNIVVLIKQVPEIEKVKFDYEKGRLDRSSAGAVINPFDLNALEAAVQIKEKVGGIITAVSMGPKTAGRSLRDALARGADQAVLLTDAKFAGADTLATSYTLASAIKKSGAFDLILCGEKTIDGDTAQVGPEVAEFLDIPHVAYVEEVREVTTETMVVKSKIGENYYAVELIFPALITVTKDINTPRLPTLRDKLRLRKAPITTWCAEDISDVAQPEYFGFSGSPTWVAKVYAPASEKRRGQFIEGKPEEVAKKVVLVLKRLNIFR